MKTLVTGSARDSVPISLITPDELSAWCKSASAPTKRWVERTGFEAESGECCLLPSSSGDVAQVLAGYDPALGPWATAALPSALPPGRYRIETVFDAMEANNAALGWALASYRFTRYRKATDKDLPRLLWPAKAERALVKRTVEAIGLIRDLINTPAGDLGPAELAQAARSVARRHKAKVTVTKGDQLLRAKYPAVHAVGRASSRAPRLIDLRWGSRGPRVTLVGKGVCFDSGGLDLKTAVGMKLMKKDMGGAAHVLGLAQMIMAAGLKVRLRMLIPAVENSVSGNAFRPGDVLQTRKGLTVEVGNTDAEGRLILCDALAEADREKPDLLLDFATLTGAARVALGPDVPALFCDHDSVAEALLDKGSVLIDPLWRMPLHAPYRRLLDSKVADLNNVSEGGQGGAITAALFLQSFVNPETPWVHIDLMAWNNAARPGRPVGGDAMGLRAAYAVIEDMAKNRAPQSRRRSKARA